MQSKKISALIKSIFLFAKIHFKKTSYLVFLVAFLLLTTISLAWAAGGDQTIPGNMLVNGSIGVGTNSPQNLIHAFSADGQAYISADASASKVSGFNIRENGVYKWLIGKSNDGNADFWLSNGSLANVLTVKQNGNFGIGTKTPASRLSVIGVGGGSVDLSVNGRIQTGDATNVGGIWLNGDKTQFIGQYGKHAIGIYNNGWSMFIGDSSAANNYGYSSFSGTLDVGGNTYVQGNLGVGTTDPHSSLEIRKDSFNGIGPIITLDNKAGLGGTAIYMNGTDVGNNPPTAAIISEDSKSYSSNLLFSTKAPGAVTNALIERMRINANGNIGIGTTTPQAKLDVTGNVTFRNNASVFGKLTVLSPTTISGAGYNNVDLSVSGRIQTGQSYNNNGGVWLNYKKTQFIGQDGADSFGLWNDGWAITINKDRNIGIGTNNPSVKLDVNGQIKITGGSPGLGKVLTSDANGLASWKENSNSNSNFWTISTFGTSIFTEKDVTIRGKDGLYVSGRIVTGDYNNNGGVWLNSSQSQFIGQDGADLLGLWNNGWAITINKDKNVGIGTTDPLYKLDVNGNGLVRGNQIITGNLEVGLLNVNNRYSLPTSKGTEGQFLSYNGTWATPSGNNIWSGDSNEATLVGSATIGRDFIVNRNSTLKGSVSLNANQYFNGPDPMISLGNGIFLSNDKGNLGLKVNNNIKGIMIMQNGNVGIGDSLTSASTINEKLYIGGDVKANGKFITTAKFQCSSDERLKKNIKPINNALEKILALKGVSFNWRKSEFPSRNLPTGKNLGFIAQQVEKVLPEAVSTDSDGYKVLDYDAISPVLVNAIKEQQANISELSQTINLLILQNKKLQQEINELKSLK